MSLRALLILPSLLCVSNLADIDGNLSTSRAQEVRSGPSQASNGIQLAKVTFARKLSKEMRAIDPGDKFPPTATINLSVEIKGHPEQGTLTCKFYWGDQFITKAGIKLDDLKGRSIARTDKTTYVGFHLTHKQPFPISKRFRAELYSGETKLGSYKFQIVPPSDAKRTEVKKTTLARGVDDKYNPVGATKAFAHSDTVHLVIRGDFGLRTWAQADWYVDGKIDRKGTRQITFQENATDSGLSFSYIPDGGWSTGKHDVVLTVNDEEVARRTFEVRKVPTKTDTPIPKTDTQPKKILEIVAKLRGATAHVEAVDEKGGTWNGTAWLVDAKRRLLVTNNHVVSPEADGEPVKRLNAWFPTYRDGELIHALSHYSKNVKPRQLKVLYTEKERDLALVQVESLPDDLTPLPLAEKSAGVGEQLYSLGGIPEGSEGLWIYTQGTVRAVYKRHLASGFMARTVEADMQTNRGNSGGPVVNNRGQLVAVVEGHHKLARSVSLYIDINEVRTFLDKALPLADPQTAELFNQRGEHHYEAERFELALADFNQALKLRRDYAEAMSNRGWIFYQQNDPQTALAEFSSAIKLDPTLSAAYQGRATIFDERGDLEEAVAELTNAIRNSSKKNDLADLYNDRGDAHYRSGQLDEAMGDFDRAIDKNPDHAWAYANRGLVLTDQDRLGQAVVEIMHAIKLKPQQGEFYNRLGSVYFAHEEYEPAIGAYTKAIQRDAKNTAFLRNRASAFRNFKRFPDAEKDLLAAIALSPQDADCFNDLALVYFDAGQYETAIKHIDKAIELDKENAIYWYNRGDASFRLRQFKQAAEALDRSIELADDPDAYALRGRVHQNLGDAAAAQRDFQSALKLAPDVYQKFKYKYLKVANNTGEPIRLWVKYFTQKEGEANEFRWYPEGADKGNAIVFDFKVGMSAVLIHDKFKIHGSRFRIWAQGAKSKRFYTAYRDNDLVLADSDGYVTGSGEPDTELFSFTPANTDNPAPTTTRPNIVRKLPRSVTINTLSYYDKTGGGAGGVCTPVKITVDKNPTESLQVAFVEDRIDAYGGMWRSAAWVATVLAADFAGFDPLKTQVTFKRHGRVDGPSAGGIMTVGILAALRGDPVRQDVAMTGTINPDGTIGPVGGIPHKIDGAAKSGKKLVLIPYGLRLGIDANTKQAVDLFQRGSKQGVEIKSVGDIYAAYALLTGVELPRPKAARAPVLSENIQQQLRQKTGEWMVRYRKYETTDEKTPQKYRSEAATEMLKEAKASAKRVAGLLAEGQAPAAYQDATTAALSAAVGSEFSRTLWVDQVRGREVAIKYARTLSDVEQKIQTAIDKLKKYEPKSLGATGALLHAYSQLVEAMACRAVATALLDGSFRFSVGETKAEQDLAALLGAAVYVQIAALDAENVLDVLEFADDVGGKPMPANAPIDVTTLFFRRTAEANLNQFERTVVASRAEEENTEFEAMKRKMMQQDQVYLLARFALDEAIPKLAKELGDGPQLRYALLGGTIHTYTLSARLMAEHYSLGVVHDEDGNPKSLRREGPLKYMLDFGEDQARRNIQILKANGVDPTPTVFFYQAGSILRGRGLEDRLGALMSFWQANIQARTLAYLGGFGSPNANP